MNICNCLNFEVTIVLSTSRRNLQSTRLYYEVRSMPQSLHDELDSRRQTKLVCFWLD